MSQNVVCRGVGDNAALLRRKVVQVLHRGVAALLFEQSRKVVVVVVAQFLGYLSKAQLALDNQCLCFFYLHCIEVVYYAFARIFFKYFPTVRR